MRKTKYFYLILFLLIFFAIKKNFYNVTDNIQSIFLYLISPFYRSTLFIKNKIVNFSFYFREKSDLLNENKMLKEELKKKQIYEVRYKQCCIEKKKLLEILSLGNSYSQKTIPVKVISRSFDNWNKFVVVDKGKKDGLQKGMPVINNYGLVGRIFSVQKSTSCVLLICDMESSIGAKVKRTGAVGIIHGKNANILDFEIFSPANVKIGDIIVTSGLSENIPSDIIIGYVAKTKKRQNGMLTWVEVKPYVDFNTLEKLLVITSK